MKKNVIKVLSVIMVVAITLTSVPLSGFLGIGLPEWLDTSIKAEAITEGKVCITDMERTDFGCYTGNVGDSRLNVLGEEREYGYGNVGVDGTVYENGFEAWIARWNYTNEISWVYATYNLNNQYTSLSCSTGLISSYNTTNFDTTVYFYDGDLLLYSVNLTDENYEFSFEVNVSGVDELTIKVQDNVAVSGGTSFALYDMFLSATSSFKKIEIGDCITLGTYYGEPIVWRCVDIDENGPLMLSEKILCLKAFDANGEDSTYHNDGWGYIRKKYGSNCWQDSNLRQWLNSDETQVSWSHCPPKSGSVSYNAYDNEAGFLSNFTTYERSLIKAVTQKVSVNIWETKRNGYCDGGSSDTGYKYLKNSSYDISQYYYKNITDRFFLLTGSQFNRIYKSNPNYLLASPTEQAVSNSDYVDDGLNSNSNFSYWINVPWGNNYACYENHMYVNSSGNVGNAWAMWGEYGVRPAFYLNVDDYNVADTESQLMINSLPTFSHEEAIDFLSFLYNRKDEFEGIDITNDIQYKLLTRNLPSDMSIDEVKGLISAFLIVVQTVLNENIKNSEVKTDFLADAMIKRLEKEVGGMSNLDEEIINQEMGKIGQLVEDGLLDIMVDAVWRTTGIRVLGEHIDNINAVISGINSVKSVASNVTSMVNYALAAVDLYGVVLGQENLARYTYFITYINNRDLGEPAFSTLMDCQFASLNLSYPLAEATDFFSSITGKSSWNEHRETLDRWGEYIYQLNEYQSKDFHRYKETKYSSTCTSDGFSKFKCIYCDKEFTGNIVKAPGHKYKKTAVAPTCEEQGYDLYQCEVCVDKYKENYIDATGHIVCKQEVIPPTCTMDGYTINYCKCGYEWQADTIVALQHNYERTIVEPTETKQGYTINECLNCGVSYNSDYINPTGHEYTVTTTEPTCEQDGLITHTCDCGETYSETVLATGHNYELDSYIISTCTATGSKIYKCTNCDSSYTETIDVLEHDYTYKTEFVESNCTEQGYSINYCKCGATLKTDYIEPIGHLYNATETTEPTCTSQGSKTFECELCGDTKTETVPSLSNGHVYELVESSELTCVTSKYELYECSVCGTQKYDNIEVFAGHTYDTCDTVNPTCTQDGRRIYTCTTCNEKVTEAIPALGHAIGEWKYSASETENQMVRCCTVCDEVLLSATNNYQVKWNVNGKIFVDYVETGYIIARPDTPDYENYRFNYWSPEVPTTMGTENLSFDAIYYNQATETYLSNEFEYTVNDGVATIIGYVGDKKTISIPTELGENAVTTIGTNAFSNNNIVENIYIDEHITTIEDGAFKDCVNLNTIIFYSSDCMIYDSADTIDSKVIFMGYSNSTAQEYAEKYGIEFISTIGDSCTITVDTENAEKGIVSETFDSVGGATVTISAEPTFKYDFNCWKDANGNVVSTDANYEFVAKGDTTLTAYFTKRQRNIEIDTENGTLTVPTKAAIESTVTVTPVENEGYVYTENSITVNGVAIEGNTFVMPDEDVVLSAEFVRNNYYFALEDALTTATAIDQTMYSAETTSALKTAIENAQNSLINDITQAESDARIVELQSAIEQLAPRYIVSLSNNLKDTLVIIQNAEAPLSSVVVTAHYDNGTSVKISNYEVTGLDISNLGMQTVTLSYQGFTTEITVRVTTQAILDVEAQITELPETITLEQEEQVNTVKTAFDALSDDEKANVQNAEVLLTAVNIIKTIYADMEIAANFDEKVLAIAEMDGDASSLVIAAMEEYASFTEQQKSYVTQYELLQKLNSAVPASEYFELGLGIDENPYVITTAQHLDLVREYPTLCYALGNDINLSGYTDWIPIDSFSGTLDGKGYSIKNLTSSQGGLINELTGTVTGVHLTNVNINFTADAPEENVVLGVVNTKATYTYPESMGSLVNTMKSGSQVLYCSAEGDLSAELVTYIGGIVGSKLNGSIKYSYADMNITATLFDDVTSSQYVGGLVGYVVLNAFGGGNISDCYSIGSITTNSNLNYCGGFIGYIKTNIASMFSVTSNSFSYMNFEGNGNNAGFIGYLSTNKWRHSNCYYVPTENITVSCGNYDTVTATACTTEQLASGEIAYALQNSREEMIWGQDIISMKPCLTTDSAYRVYKLTFRNSSLVIDEQYFFNDKELYVPNITPFRVKNSENDPIEYYDETDYKFIGWYDENGVVFGLNCKPTSDVVFNATFEALKAIPNDTSILTIDNENGIISGIEINNNYVHMLEENFNEDVYIRVYHNDAMLNTDSMIATGDLLQVVSADGSEVYKEYQLAVTGDVNGDGLANISDYEIIVAVSTCMQVLETPYNVAADINSDGAVDAFDVIETDLQSLDMHNIEQKNTAAYLSKDESEESEEDA